jgi:ATP-dependent RNA helicase SUPV3L1/SUV3
MDGLVKAPPAEDVGVLEIALRDPATRALADRRERVALLWEVCQIPDYRRIAPANHAELVLTIFNHLARRGAIEDDWFAAQVAHADRTDGDIDTLANRIAHIRTWTFAANRPRWLGDPAHWQERTRAIEDRLSDALHERLTQRFVDRRTSVLMRRLRENAMLDAEVTATGDVLVEGQHVGQLQGFRFAPDPGAVGPDGKALRAAAQKSLAGEIERRAERLAAARNTDFVLATDGIVRWQGDSVARVTASDDLLKPRLILLADEMLTGALRDGVQARLDLWLADHGRTLLKPLFDLRAAKDLPPAARGLAFRLVENLGVLERPEVADEVRALDQPMRAGLRRLGVRFGAYHIYVPPLLKPAPSQLLALLWAIKNGDPETPGIAELPRLSASGRTTIPVDPTFPRALYRTVGFKVAGPRAVRIDILERLADLIRPLLAWRPTPENPAPPEGAVAGGGFTVTVAMTSLLGCSGAEFTAILQALGYRVDRRPLPPKVIEPQPATAAEATPPAEGEPLPETAAAEASVAPELTGTPEGAEPTPPEPAQAEPQFIEIWRPGGGNRRAAQQRERHQHRRPRPQETAPAAGASTDSAAALPATPAPEPRADRPPRKPHRPRRPDRNRDERKERVPVQAARRPERPIDPDSPFAALAALKSQLESQGRK